MIVKIRVEPLKDNEDISFGAIVLYHDTCVDRPMAKRRNVLSGDYTLKCICGLEMELPADGQAQQAIVRVAIGSEPATVEASQVRCNCDVDYVALSAV